MVGSMTIRVQRHTRLARRNRMPGDCMTCMAMSGSGVRMGTARIRAVRRRIQPASRRARSGCTGAAAGTTTRGSAVRRTATGARLGTGASALAFVCSAVPSSRPPVGSLGRPEHRQDRLADRRGQRVPGLDHLGQIRVNRGVFGTNCTGFCTAGFRNRRFSR